MGDQAKYLHNLNEAQYSAIMHEPTTPLQILAGPGSGKTRTLTCRIAHLIEYHRIPSSKIVVVTFTNKAANELRVRLEDLIGAKAASALTLGTFHAICGQLLRRHGSKIKIPGNFTILSADESKKLLKAILNETVASSGAHASGGKRADLKDGLLVELISKIKAKGLSPDEFEAQTMLRAQSQQTTPKGEIELSLAQQLCPIYATYVEDCRRNNSLDFDDLLMYGVKLLGERNDCVDCQHIFVDEFQDTNSIQFRLMTLFAKMQRNISVVGDPDQSIYGWRSAEIENLNRMRVLFPETKQIFLEDNYRSTGAILATAVAIISEDTTRPPKTLRTSHPAGAPVTLGHCADENEEALCIAEEIKRLKMTSGGLLKWSDFSILLRFNALSRNLETALQKEGIPSRVLAGARFFDRVEVKDLIAYLQLIDNPNFDQAAYRVLNVPKRNIGDKTLQELRLRSIKLNKPVMYVIEKIVEGRIPDISPSVQQKAKPFIQSMRNLRQIALEGVPLSELIECVLKELSYAEHLQKNYPDWESRWENVRELITFAMDVVPASTNMGEVANTEGEPRVFTEQENAPREEAVAARASQAFEQEIAKVKENSVASQAVIDLTEDEVDEEVVPDRAEVITPLRVFLQNTSLATDAMAKDEESKSEKVTISTCHAAKGLEWPVVFIPSVEEGTFPFYRTDDIEEERRLLYVACTRAQVLLYLTTTKKRKLGGEERDQKISKFLTDVIEKNKKKMLFTDKKPTLNYAAFRLISKVLERECPGPEQVEEGEQDYCKINRSRPITTTAASNPRSSQDAPVQTSPSQSKAGPKNFRFKSITGTASQPGIAHAAVFSTARIVAGSLSQDQNLIPSTARNNSHLNTHFTHNVRVASAPTGTSNGLREKEQNVVSTQPITNFYRPQIASSHQSGTPPAWPISIPVSLPPQLVTHLTASAGISPSLQQPDSSNMQAPPKIAGTKRRLGMSSSGADYPRKK